MLHIQSLLWFGFCPSPASTFSIPVTLLNHHFQFHLDFCLQCATPLDCKLSGLSTVLFTVISLGSISQWLVQRCSSNSKPKTEINMLSTPGIACFLPSNPIYQWILIFEDTAEDWFYSMIIFSQHLTNKTTILYCVSSYLVKDSYQRCYFTELLHYKLLESLCH